MVHALVTNPVFDWSVVLHYLTAHLILLGLLRTLELTALSMVIGVCLGIVLATLQLSRNRILSRLAWLYVWFFRGTPLLVQIIFWYNLASLYSRISIGIPYGPSFFSGQSNSILTPLVAGLLALGLNEAAYMAEIIRGGIIGVDKGQMEAANSIGMTRVRALRRIVLPQAMRLIIPPTGNETISMLKTTSLVSTISIAELLYSVQIVYSRTYQTIPLLIVASIWYLGCTTILSIGQYFLERRFGRSSASSRGKRDTRGFVTYLSRGWRIRTTISPSRPA
ncbi:MAG: amino acid ABC transporter permease [Sulfobacillus sp.]